jgi:hypothetical protein
VQRDIAVPKAHKIGMTSRVGGYASPTLESGGPFGTILTDFGGCEDMPTSSKFDCSSTLLSIVVVL